MQKSGVLIYKNSKEVIPTDILDKVIKDFGKSSGWALAAKDEGEEYSSISSQQYASAVLRDKFDEFHLQVMDFPVIFYFGKETKNVEHVQPFLLVKSPDGQPAMVGFFIGDFIGYADKDKNHTPEYNVAKHVSGWLQRVFDDTEGDLEALRTHVQQASFKTEIEKLYSKTGTILLLDADGETFTFGNESIDQHDWGWHTSYLEAVAAAPVAAPAAKKSRFGGYGSPAPVATEKPAVAASAPSAAPAAAPVASVPAAGKSSRFGGSQKQVVKPVNEPSIKSEMPPPPKTDTKILGSEMVWVAPNMGLSLNKAKKFYEHLTGTYPEDWKDKPAIQITKEVYDRNQQKMKNQGIVVDPKALKDFRTAGTIHKTKNPPGVYEVPKEPVAEANPKRGSEIAAQRAAASTKDVAPHVVGKSVSDQRLLVLSPETKAKLKLMMDQGTLVKTVDVNSIVVHSPEQLENMGKLAPTLAESMGMDGFTITDQWDNEMVYKLCRELPEAAARLLVDYRLAWLKVKAGMAKVDDKPKILDASGTPVSSAKIEEPATAPAAKKHSRFGGYKAA